MTALRGLVLLALAITLWAVGAWLLEPRLPVGSGRDITLFPFVAASVNASLRGSHAAGVAISAYALVAATLVPAALLATWLGWRAATRAAARRLALAFSLGALAGSYFWFLRDVEPWMFGRTGAAAWLDPVAMIALAYALVALVACFRIYPEPTSLETVQRALDQHRSREDRWVADFRAARGAWRAWSFLPRERYGAHGRAVEPGERGIRRVLRSRELLWVAAASLVVAYGMLATDVMPGGSAVLRLVFWVSSASLVVMLLDPLLAGRLGESGSLRAMHRGGDRLVASAEHAINRVVGSVPGLIVVALVAIWTTALWRSGEPDKQALAAVMLFGAAIGATAEALSLLMLNWRAGNETNRRAIAWVFIGTAGAVLAWVLVLSITAAWATVVWDDGSEAAAQARRALGAVAMLGPPALGCCAVLATTASVLTRGTFDAGLALKRGAGYALLGIVLTALFVAAEGLISSFVVVRFGLPSQSGALIAGTSIALVFGPVRSVVEMRIKRLVDRLLPVESLADAERLPCVVAFCDLVGYTSLAAINEKESLEHAALLHAAARRTVAGHGGRVVKTLGDAVLAVYAEDCGALLGLADIHRAYGEAAAAQSLDPLPLHASAHRGEVAVARDGDVFGADVNLAARLLGLAGADELVATAALGDAARDLSLPVELLPPTKLRNVPEPVSTIKLRLRRRAAPIA